MMQPQLRYAHERTTTGQPRTEGVFADASATKVCCWLLGGICSRSRMCGRLKASPSRPSSPILYWPTEDEGVNVILLA